MLKSASGFKHIGTNIVLFNGACDLRLDRGIASAPLRRANMIPWFGGIPRRDAPVAAPRGLSSCSAGPPLFGSAVDQQVSIFQGKTVFIQGRHSLVRQLISFGLVTVMSLSSLKVILFTLGCLRTNGQQRTEMIHCSLSVTGPSGVC